MSDSSKKIAVGVLGASGYTGAETLRLILEHPNIEIRSLTADRKAGQDISTVFPHLGGAGLPTLLSIDDVDFDALDAVFCCLPHATTQKVIRALPDHLKVIDLSADFRLTDTATYAEWYGHEHFAPELQERAVYGLTELNRTRIAKSRLIACPGCYPTSALLPLVPLLRAGLVDADDIVIDAKSGVSGAGRSLKEAMLFAEVAEGINAYGVAGHRHAPEIEQELSAAAGHSVVVNFTPHLMPMNRGILATIYVRAKGGANADSVREAWNDAYADEPFVRALPAGASPATRHVRASNHCLLGAFDDRIQGRIILLSAIDNLVKGSSGQAVQNFNIAFGLPETLGISAAPLFP